jgi:hypothetical protein
MVIVASNPDRSDYSRRGVPETGKIDKDVPLWIKEIIPPTLEFPD